MLREWQRGKLQHLHNGAGIQEVSAEYELKLAQARGARSVPPI